MDLPTPALKPGRCSECRQWLDRLDDAHCCLPPIPINANLNLAFEDLIKAENEMLDVISRDIREGNITLDSSTIEGCKINVENANMKLAHELIMAMRTTLA